MIIGCGYTGSALATQLSAASVDVIGVRRGPRNGDTSLPYRLKLLDLTSESRVSLPEAEGAMVYYMVGPTGESGGYDPQNRTHLAPINRVLAALAAAPPRGLVYLSSTSVYGDREGNWIDETTPPSPGSPWGQMRVDIEKRFWETGKALAIPTTVVRLPEIYGPGRGPVERLARGYRLRAPERYSNRIHVADLVDILELLGQREQPRLLLAADGHPARTDEIYAYAARVAGLAPPQSSSEMPKDPNIRALVSHSKRCRNARLVEWLGKPLRFPSYKEGIEESLKPKRD